MFIISSIAGKVTMDGMTFWTATSSIGSIFIIIIAIQPILREKKLRELQYSGGLQIAMTKDATIVLVNKTDEPLETIKINQKIYSGECLKEQPKGYVKIIIEGGTPEPTGDNVTRILINQAYKKVSELKKQIQKEYNEKMRNTIDSIVSEKDQEIWDNEQEDCFKLMISPGETIGWPVSLGHDLKYGKSGVPYCLFRVEVYFRTLNGSDKRSIKAFFRFSLYTPPEGWVKVSS